MIARRHRPWQTGSFFAALLALCASGNTQSAHDSGPPLASAAQLRALSAEQAALELPVRLRAVVTMIEPARTVFIQDGTGASFVRHRPLLPQLSSGDVIDIEGVTYEGLYVTGIEPHKVTVAGRGPLPDPIDVNFEQLASGQFNYEWVRGRGIVRGIEAKEDRHILLLALGGGRTEVHLPLESPPPDLTDAAIEVTGLAAGFINERRQLVAPFLRVRSLEDISVIEPPPAEPFGIQATPAANLLRFSPQSRAGHRVKVRGVVTLHLPGTAVFIRDEGVGLMVQTSSPETLTPGDEIEALGFPSMGLFSAQMEDAVFRTVGHGASAAPVETTADALLNGRHDFDLVSVTGDILEAVFDDGLPLLLVQDSGMIFRARWHPRDPAKPLPEPSSRVRLTGVCRIVETGPGSLGFRARPGSYELLLREAPVGVVLLQRPSWWTPSRLALAAYLLLGLMLLALLWVAALRRQVARQTRLLREKVEAEAAMEERQRIAREFHDTLEQELVGLALRLDAAATRASDTRQGDLLASARRLVQQLQTGTRSFVWNLRDSPTTALDLPEAISEAVQRHAGGCEIVLDLEGDNRPIDAVISHELLRVAQESVANAVKHGRARQVGITLAFEPSQIRVSVRDNGAGFDPSRPVPPGHFGLIGLRERVQKLGGTLDIRSAPGNGTTIDARVPLRQTLSRHA
jgi:signal transduction histidine kinase